ncbi:TRM11 family SAM-dependent methyltransferase [Paenibacillus sinopodophylli]|uniref:TRM11 family SAM-dependent methyltransferase n=1 Tax=Paenibacillus sinopodophylli TaxID=1837342 RepID=UPI00110D0FB1|nr:RNA methyltransferase [Paenibacillus sinopodophylli]
MFIYTYACHEDEADLCALELQTLFGQTAIEGVLISPYSIHVDRSPFFKRRIEVVMQADSLHNLLPLLSSIKLDGLTFKVVYTQGDEAVAYDEQRQLERAAGAAITGKADMRKPERQFGLMKLQGSWFFGLLEENSAVWLRHQSKPQNYSTALPTRAARAIVNIAAGRTTERLRVIDPCCGMGTVLVEALSMGISIEGLDLNPLAVRGARTNLAYYGYPDVVRLGDMRLIEGKYDAAIVDLPYNLCSVLPEAEQLDMLVSIKRWAKSAVIITTEPIERQLLVAGLRTTKSTTLSKASFTRYISVVE